jgi:glycopeptide antibiotics resistance protein
MLHRHPVLAAITVLYLAGVALVTLGPTPYDDSTGDLLSSMLRFFSRHAATDWLTYDRVEFGANIAMFVPIGLFLVLLFGRRLWWLAILVSVALSVVIEVSQGAFLPTRVSDLRDVVSNGTGGILGVVLGVVLTAITDAYRRARGSKAAPDTV